MGSGIVHDYGDGVRGTRNVIHAVCPSCAFWGRNRHGQCLWCGDASCAPQPGVLRRGWSQAKRLCRIGKRVARDGRVPRWLRWTILGGIVAGPFLLGPFDEIIVACLIAFVVYRYPVVWREHAAMVDQERELAL